MGYVSVPLSVPCPSIPSPPKLSPILGSLTEEPNNSDFADENPASEVIGVDLSPIQPSFVPPNCKFEVDDITKDWTFPESHFDFIHIRYLTGCIPEWVSFYKKAMRYVPFAAYCDVMADYGLTVQYRSLTIIESKPCKAWRVG